MCCGQICAKRVRDDTSERVRVAGLGLQAGQLARLHGQVTQEAGEEGPDGKGQWVPVVLKVRFSVELNKWKKFSNISRKV